MELSPAPLSKISVFLFPGINCIARKKDRRRALYWDEVQARLQRAQNILTALGEPHSLLSHLERETPELCSSQYLHLTAISVLAIQLGITDRLKKVGIVPDWLMGCSLGDLARSVYSQAAQFDDVIRYQHRLFIDFGKNDDRFPGLNLGIRASTFAPFTPEDLAWFKTQKLSVSIMSPRFVQVSCDATQHESIRQKARQSDWKVNLSDFQFMLHNKQLQQISDRALGSLARATIREPQFPMYSSILNQPIENIEQLKIETSQLLWNPLCWVDSVKALYQHYNVDQFINIGPCKSLAALHREIVPGNRALDAIDIGNPITAHS